MNLILDEHGEPWIADFGLARIVDSGASLTVTGDLLGTLRYMSPEQVSAQRTIADHRTDIYSLGVTLYELLTLEPAFAAGSREELLRRIASEEPRPPRRLNGAVPLELETIVLTAMAKQPFARYATAHALADDLRRYLLDQPIHARRPTALERLQKWSRRHKPLVASVSISALATLLLAVAALAISYATITREQKRTTQALADAKAGHAAAASEREQADTNLRQALAAMDRMLSRISHEEAGFVPQAAPMRRQLLEDALEFYQGFLQQQATDPAVQREMARTYQRIGGIQKQLGQLGPAELALRRGLADLERLSAQHPDTPENLAGVGDLCTDLGYLLREIPGREDEAEQAYRRSVAAWGRLMEEHPDLPGYHSQLAQAYHELGYFLGSRKRFVEAEEALDRALSVRVKPTAQSPNDATARHVEATYLNSLGLLLRKAGRPRDAEPAHRRALLLLEEEAKSDKASDDHGNQLARSLTHLALAVEQFGRRAEAESLLRRALELRVELLNDGPASSQGRSELALTSTALAGIVGRDGRPAEAEPLYHRAVDLLDQLVSDFPGVPKHRHDLAATLEKQGRYLIDDQRLGEAEPVLRRALGLRKELASQSPDAQECRRDMAYCQLLSAMVGWRLGEKEQAQAWYDRAVEWMENHPGDDAELHALQREVGQAFQPDE
jgi:tetratricopeptide (TPR) repeat protein